MVVGTDAGISPEVKVYTAQTGMFLFDLHPFSSNFQGGIRVAVGDLNGDGVPDIITAQGPGSASNGDSLVQVFDGIAGQPLTGPLGNLDPFPGFHVGLFVVSADVNGVGFPNLIVSQDAGSQGWVKIYSGQDGSLLAQFQPFGNFPGGVRLAAGPVTTNGHVDVVTGAGPGGLPKVEVFDGPSLIQRIETPVSSFNAFDPSFTGGVYLATGLIHDQGEVPAEIIVGEGAGDQPRVSVFDGTGTPLQSFLAFDPGFKGGVRVAAADVNGDGRSEIVTAQGPGPGSLPRVRAFDGVSLQEIDNFLAFAPKFRGGIFVAGGGKWGIFNPALTVSGGDDRAPLDSPVAPAAQSSSFDWATLDFGAALSAKATVKFNGQVHSDLATVGPSTSEVAHPESVAFLTSHSSSTLVERWSLWDMDLSQEWVSDEFFPPLTGKESLSMKFF